MSVRDDQEKYLGQSASATNSDTMEVVGEAMEGTNLIGWWSGIISRILDCCRI